MIYLLRDKDIPYQKKFHMRCILLCEGMTPKQQLEVVTKRINENSYDKELEVNFEEDLKVTCRRLHLLAQGEDPFK